MKGVAKALVLTGYGLNCDYETDFSLKKAGAVSERVHVNDLLPAQHGVPAKTLHDYHILVLGGGFSWGDDHGAGVLLASRIKIHLGRQLEQFIEQKKLILGVCNGFQALVNLGLLPGFNGDYHSRKVALIANDCGNFRNDWIGLAVNNASPCVFTRNIEYIELPVRHGEGKFYADPAILETLEQNNQIVLRYAGKDHLPAQGTFPYNPNGSLRDIAGICDTSGRILGLMPHPEAHNHWTNHPAWTRKSRQAGLANEKMMSREGEGLKLFHNAVAYIQETLL
jgi:phosphoribosylformylglycinamidine synthase subunit PurQ / glutaminase